MDCAFTFTVVGGGNLAARCDLRSLLVLSFCASPKLFPPSLHVLNVSTTRSTSRACVQLVAGGCFKFHMHDRKDRALISSRYNLPLVHSKLYSSAELTPLLHSWARRSGLRILRLRGARLPGCVVGHA
eukprot:6183935-Pleurochrysis_carterae.AAC.1